MSRPIERTETEMTIADKVRLMLDSTAKEPGLGDMMALLELSQESYEVQQVQAEMSAPYPAICQVPSSGAL